MAIIQFEPTIGTELQVERHRRNGKQGPAHGLFADQLADQLKQRAEMDRLERIAARRMRAEQVLQAADPAAGHPPRLVLVHPRTIRGEATAADEPAARALPDQSGQLPDSACAAPQADESDETVVEIEPVVETADVADDKEQVSDQVVAAPEIPLLPAEQQAAEGSEDPIVTEVDPPAPLVPRGWSPMLEGLEQAASGETEAAAADESKAEEQLAEAVRDANLSAAVELLGTDGAAPADAVTEVGAPVEVLTSTAPAAKPAAATPPPAAPASVQFAEPALPPAHPTRPAADVPQRASAGARAELTPAHGSPAHGSPAPSQGQIQPQPVAATPQPAGQPETPVATFENTAPASDEAGPGWALHLAQGAVGKRAEFVAQLRQHLQNLPPHEQVAVHIQRALRDGTGRFSIQLSPAELGRVQVKLEIDEEKRVKAAVTVERPSTLELLQRDIKGLERALHDAGLKMDGSDLSFSLGRSSDQDWAQEQGPFGSARAGEDQVDVPSESDQPKAAQDDVLDTAAGVVNMQV